MADTSHLKSMLQSLINGREEDAAVQLHNYFVDKTREVAGLQQEPVIDDAEVDELEDTVDTSITDDEPSE